MRSEKGGASQRSRVSVVTRYLLECELMLRVQSLQMFC